MDDDDDFIDALAEFWYDISNISMKELQEKVFVPFELNDGKSHHPLYNIDPDFNYYSQMNKGGIDSNYYIEDTFIKKYNSYENVNNAFSLIHTNIRSAVKNLKSFSMYLDSLCADFSVIALSETWLSADNESLYIIPNYCAVNNYRETRRGGGVSLLIRNNIGFVRRVDLDKMSHDIESIFIEIPKENINTDRNVIIGSIYRPPNSNCDEFLSYMKTILNIINQDNKCCYLAGDYNLNLLNAEKHTPTGDFVDTLFMNCFVPLINKPTRIRETSATLIDNIFTNNVDSNCFQGILYTDISDHLPVFCIPNQKSVIMNLHLSLEESFQKLTLIILLLLYRILIGLRLCLVKIPQEAYSLFHNRFSSSYHKAYPLKTFQIRYRNRKPWLTPGLKKKH